MKRIGVWILRLSGWEVALILLAIEALIWAISPKSWRNGVRPTASEKGLRRRLEVIIQQRGSSSWRLKRLSVPFLRGCNDH
ncbi:hypothetical protein [Stenotrophomonas sp.]|uniref:hypothetical protein n=1 Tax=Stenotrophomonas sp. TaxID=69392 RepID=UPI0028970E06|nr:hypothetical protein [Stenotrophomonas sp.]